MSTVTLGTTLTTSLTALSFSHAEGDADTSAIAQLILNDSNPAHPIVPGAFTRDGMLFVPRRGVLKIFPGDYVGVDNQGWPILVSANSIANGNWTHS